MSKKITIFQIEDNETGPKTIEVGGSSIKAIYSPRARLKELLDREEYESPGVYLLKSDPNNENYNERIYIGEADPLNERLKQHLTDSSRDFKECISIISMNSGELNKAHIKNMESKLVKMAYEAKNAEIDNKNTPTKSTLSEADDALVDLFINQIKAILPLCGYSVLIPTTVKVIDNDEIKEKVFIINRKNINARMIITQEGYIVLKGSTACKETTPSLGSYKEQREKLIKENIMILDGEFYIFKQDTVFSSPSAASCIILGTSTSGPEEWKDKNGIKLKEKAT